MLYGGSMAILLCFSIALSIANRLEAQPRTRHSPAILIKKTPVQNRGCR